MIEPIFSLWDKRNYGHCIYTDEHGKHYANTPDDKYKEFQTFTDAYNYIVTTYIVTTYKA